MNNRDKAMVILFISGLLLLGSAIISSLLSPIPTDIIQVNGANYQCPNTPQSCVPYSYPPMHLAVQVIMYAGALISISLLLYATYILTRPHNLNTTASA